MVDRTNDRKKEQLKSRTCLVPTALAPGGEDGHPSNDAAPPWLFCTYLRDTFRDALFRVSSCPTWAGRRAANADADAIEDLTYSLLADRWASSLFMANNRTREIRILTPWRVENWCITLGRSGKARLKCCWEEDPVVFVGKWLWLGDFDVDLSLRD
ncbi:uncharacterized protein E0L32_003201 [Thyridium curvatum]|uniref:Uncharacterized protein n=1 Tax=Thyridium curvatum TaxID=1093900 RepID=A0A507BC35_9PEZI|nr:uncharacterized protein E0L32_003201 [Thyridium curvatum]TPX17083.1 hypothetical protein E0L32_003201 [Thyridium curvatum]